MKKITLSILAFGAFMLSAQAQETKSESKEIRFGVKTGLNLANITNTDEGKVRASFHIGGVAEFAVNESFSIQPELIYSRQGSKATMNIYESETIVNVDAVMKLDYINIPVMAKYYIKDGFSIQAGPQVGFVVKAEAEAETSVMGMTVKASESMKSEVSSVDFGVNFGLGYELPVGVFFDARYNLGITKVNSESFDSMKNIKNSVFQLSVGYKF